MALVTLSNGFQMNVDVHAGLAPMDTVFMHGNLASNTWWEPSLGVWKNQAKPSYEGRLVFAEWRGCGKSAAPQAESDLHPSVLADDYIALLKELGVKKACIVAHSTGGLIAMYAMLKEPTLFDRAVFLDPVGPGGVQFEQPMYDAFTQMSQNKEFCAMIMGSTIHGNDASSPLFARIVEDTFNIARHVWHGVPNMLSTVNITKEVTRIQHPILILHGEHDPILPKEGSLELAKILPNARYVELKDQGHSTNVENPALFVSSVNEFLFHRP